MKKLPLLLSIAMSIGILIGTFLANHFSGNRINIINTGTNKLNYLLQLIDNSYVDTVDINQVVDEAIPSILSELDPHSAYFNASDAEAANEDLRGSFSGIGIQYRMAHDTVMVMSVIHGGPAEKVGILSGDRIITAGKKNLCKLESTEVQKYIKGKKGTHVKLTIVRRGHTKPLTFDVERGDIPVYTIDASYMIEPGIGYIRVKSFGEQTYAELLSALAKLNMRGMKSLILDLRGNRGGYMHIAIQMVNEFLSKNKLIVYTQGRKSPREEFVSDGRGSFQDLPLVVLVDEGSASASEIVAGAVQDNDRGSIVGLRTVGKGLVQQPMEFRDGSVVRLTVARYYTPSGRCIQKPYVKGHDEDYEMDLIARYERGEYFSQDSIHQDGPEYATSMGRIVYGGGGIMPDYFVPEDTSELTSYYKEAVITGLLRQFAFKYTDEQRTRLESFSTLSKLQAHLERQNLSEQFAQFADKKGLRKRNLLLRKSRRLFEQNLIGNIIYNVRSMEEYVQYVNVGDPTIDKAISLIHEGMVMPQPGPMKVPAQAR